MFAFTVQQRRLPDRARPAVGCDHDWQADDQQCTGGVHTKDEGVVAQ